MTNNLIDEKSYNGAITFLTDEDGATIEIHDRASSTMFCKIKLTASQLALMLSRRSHTPCDMETAGLERVGKKMIMDKLEFAMPESSWNDRKEVAGREAIRQCPEGWKPDCYFGSKHSFFTKGAKEYATTIIRKWVEL